tara:strand:+ start:537 stop:740 length:204 start_codon:yes stop_codon:yes gene_type:complete
MEWDSLFKIQTILVDFESLESGMVNKDQAMHIAQVKAEQENVLDHWVCECYTCLVHIHGLDYDDIFG